jgi:hypothetical protein
MMNREEILQLNSGREIDILVAEQVMGWQVELDPYRVHRLDHYFSTKKNNKWWRKPEGGWYDSPPSYSSDITAAWEVVERMNSRGQAIFMLKTFDLNQVAFDQPSKANPDYITEKTVAGAICKAALVATM